MGRKILIEAIGGTEVMQLTEFAPGKPGPREVLIEQTAIGVNFIDIYHREGLYPIPLPFTPGVEAVGRVIDTGAEVTNFKVGDRVAYMGAESPGAYSTHRIWPSGRLVKLPDKIGDQEAAGMLVKGVTAEYLIHRTFPIKEGDWVLFHAAAGGVGSIAGQWLNHLGAKVIGTVGSKEKAEMARANGYHHTILYNEEDVAQKVREITEGRGVDVVYDSVGKSTFEASLDSLKPRGMMVSFGNASGPVPEFKPLILSAKGSLFFTRPTVKHYYSTDEDFETGTQTLLKAVAKGVVKIHVSKSYSLKDAAKAHSDLEARKTTGSVVLIP